MTLELKEDDIVSDGVRIGAVKYSRKWERWFWHVGEAVGDERTRGGVLSVVRMYLAAQAGRAA